MNHGEKKRKCDDKAIRSCSAASTTPSFRRSYWLRVGFFGSGAGARAPLVVSAEPLSEVAEHDMEPLLSTIVFTALGTESMATLILSAVRSARALMSAELNRPPGRLGPLLHTLPAPSKRCRRIMVRRTLAMMCASSLPLSSSRPDRCSPELLGRCGSPTSKLGRRSERSPSCSLFRRRLTRRSPDETESCQGRLTGHWGVHRPPAPLVFALGLRRMLFGDWEAREVAVSSGAAGGISPLPPLP